MNSGRYSSFSNSIQWLISAGLINQVFILTHAEVPLRAYVEENSFKAYLFDVGLVGALAELPTTAFIKNDDLFETFKGAFAENFVLQEFKSIRKETMYCWQGKNSEVDFLFQDEMNLSPVEVKSGKSGKLKSLHAFSDKYRVIHKTRLSQ